jgi:transposase
MADVDQGLGTKATAEKYRVSADWVRKLKRFRRQTGSFAARQQRVSHATKLDHVMPRLEQLVQERPDATLKELREALGVQVALGTVWRALKRLQITFKKSDPCCGAAAAGRPGTSRRLDRGATRLGAESSRLYR